MAIALTWTAVALVGVIGVFGPPLQWPAWMMDISPDTQIPRLPGGTVPAASLLWLCAAVRDRIVVYASFEPSRQAAEHE